VEGGAGLAPPGLRAGRLLARRLEGVAGGVELVLQLGQAARQLLDAVAQFPLVRLGLPELLLGRLERALGVADRLLLPAAVGRALARCRRLALGGRRFPA